MQSIYGLTNVFGPYTGSLKHSGTLQMIDEHGAVLLTVPYSNATPWPVASDGTGHSIVLANPTYGEEDPRAWEASEQVGGSPGADDTVQASPLRSVLLNEIRAEAGGQAQSAFIELYNHSAQADDLSGCILTDDPTTPKFVVPTGTAILPAGFTSF